MAGTLQMILQWLQANVMQVSLTCAVFCVFILLDRFSRPRLKEGADQGDFEQAAAIKAVRLLRLAFGFFGALVVAVVWGVNFASVTVFATTTITLLGVALFASWSMISNVTAYFVLLLHPSYARGNRLRVLDGDNYVEGAIADLTLFSTKLHTPQGETILYPNNLLLSRVTLVNPKDRLDAMGKLPTVTKASDAESPAAQPNG